jgi:hypothetical protein
MDTKKHTGRAVKQIVLDLLKSDDFDQKEDELRRLPGRQVINPLFSFLCHSDQKVKWRAVTAMGVVVSDLAKKDMESARIIMRRLMWSLNDESGGIGWGAPEPWPKSWRVIRDFQRNMPMSWSLMFGKREIFWNMKYCSEALYGA